jgi:hypothetical protein
MNSSAAGSAHLEFLSAVRDGPILAVQVVLGCAHPLVVAEPSGPGKGVDGYSQSERQNRDPEHQRRENQKTGETSDRGSDRDSIAGLEIRMPSDVSEH